MVCHYRHRGCMILPCILGRYYFSILTPLHPNLIFISERTKLSQKKKLEHVSCFQFGWGKIAAKRAGVLCRIWYVTRGISWLLRSPLVRKSSMFHISSSGRTKLSQNKKAAVLCRIWCVTRGKKKRRCFVLRMGCH